MRRFATWTTGHRKTVIIGWIAALIVIGDDRRLGRLRLHRRIQAARLRLHRKPSTCSKTSSRRSRATPRRSSSRPTAGSNRRRCKKKMEGVFAEVEEVPARQRSRQPLRRAAAPAAISDDGKIAYATVQFDVPTNKLDKDEHQEDHRDRRGRRRRRPAGRARRPADRGSRTKKKATPRSRSACWRRSSSCCSPSARWWRWGCRSSPRCSRSASASAWSRSAPTSSTRPNFAPHAGGDDRPRRRHRLRALHPHPLPQRPRRRAGAARRRRSPPSTPPAAPSSSPGSR